MTTPQDLSPDAPEPKEEPQQTAAAVEQPPRDDLDDVDKYADPELWEAHPAAPDRA
jgi:hypothetical protein